MFPRNFLGYAVDESRATLATRYGRARLNATSIFSHNQEALAARIADALNNNQPLRFGLTGGSHAVGTDEGGWATNLTRWVDDVLGRGMRRGRRRRGSDRVVSLNAADAATTSPQKPLLAGEARLAEAPTAR